MIKEVCSVTSKKQPELHFSNSSPNSTEIPKLDAQTANQLLNNVFEACDMEPSTIPVEVLESWGNYKKPAFDLGKMISYVFIVILILLPLMFFHPNIAASRINVNSATDATYNIHIQTLLPVTNVSASLDGEPVALIENSQKEYTATLTKNGSLTITATTFNGQKTTRTYAVTHLDTDKPEFIQSYTQDDKVYLVVQDTFSGIDYENITGLTPLSYDESTGTIVFQIPEAPQTVTIPDHAGNELTLLISPVDTNK